MTDVPNEALNAAIPSTGWICPKCGRGVAPSEKTCDHGGMAGAPLWPTQIPVWPTEISVPLTPNPNIVPMNDPRLCRPECATQACGCTLGIHRAIA